MSLPLPFRFTRATKPAWIAGALVGLMPLAPSLFAQDRIEITVPGTAANPGSQGALNQLLMKKLPGQPQATLDRAAKEFLDHLKETSPIIAEDFDQGRMSPDDLNSRLDIFLDDHPEYSGKAATAAVGDPRQRIVDLLKDSPDLAATDAARRALAERFIDRLGSQSGTARAALMDGSMTDSELQSRVSVFVTDVRAEASRVAADPAVAAVPPIVDAYVKANFGSATDRANAMCFRGSVEEGAKRRQFVVFKKRPKYERIHVIENGLVVGVMAFDGTTPWIESPGKPPVVATGNEADDIVRTSQFDDPLVGYNDRGAEVRLLDRPANGPVQLEIREADGTRMIVAIDPKTNDELYQKQQRPGGPWIETRFSDYRKIGTVNVAFVREEWQEGTLRLTTRLTDVTVDPGLIDKFFQRPEIVAFEYMDFMGGLAVLQARAHQEQAQANAGAPKITPVR